jgi:hypothetical protein
VIECGPARTIASMPVLTDEKAPRLPPHLVRELAVEVPCDPRTLLKAIAGGPVSTLRLVAIRRTLASRGLVHLLPSKVGDR